MKKIYIVLTYTGTILSKIVRAYTKREYGHSSISLNKELTRMYSFGRYNPYIAFWGGYIKEDIHTGTFKRFKDTKAAIYSLEVTDEQYAIIEQEIERTNKVKEQYKFNILGLCAVLINKKVKRKNKFYCSEYIKYLLDKAKITTETPEITTPSDLQKIPNLNLIYEGKLRDFDVKKL